jgi:hypothetical protein
MSGEAIGETVSPARAEMSPKTDTGRAGSGFWAWLATPSKLVNAIAIVRIGGVDRVCVLGASSPKARSLYPGGAGLSTRGETARFLS